MLEVAKDVKKSAMGHEQHAWLFIRLRCDPGQAGDKPNFLGLAPGCINADLCKQIVNTDFSAFLEIINSNLHRILLVHIIMSAEKERVPKRKFDKEERIQRWEDKRLPDYSMLDF